jgi:hypothetical protein
MGRLQATDSRLQVSAPGTGSAAQRRCLSPFFVDGGWARSALCTRPTASLRNGDRHLAINPDNGNSFSGLGASPLLAPLEAPGTGSERSLDNHSAPIAFGRTRRSTEPQRGEMQKPGASPLDSIAHIVWPKPLRSAIRRSIPKLLLIEPSLMPLPLFFLTGAGRAPAARSISPRWGSGFLSRAIDPRGDAPGFCIAPRWGLANP